jgi:iron complex transport system substrate-binding protein
MRTASLILLLWGGVAMAAPQRIVSTSPVITETLFALGAGPRVVGVSTYCRYPMEASSRTRIGTYLEPNVEAIVRLKPDLVLVEKLPNRAIEQLTAAAIPLRTVVTGNLAANMKLMEDVAEAAGVKDRGLQLTARLRQELNALKISPGTARVRVVFVVGRSPRSLDNLIAAGRASYLDELIALAGGENVIDSALAYAKISLETMIRARPGVIVDMGEMGDAPGVSEAKQREVQTLWGARKEIRAQVRVVADDRFAVPGPRMVEAVRALKAIFAEAARP